MTKAMSKFMCQGKASRYIVAGLLGAIVGGVIYRATRFPFPGLTLALIGTYIYRSTSCKL